MNDIPQEVPAATTPHKTDKELRDEYRKALVGNTPLAKSKVVTAFDMDIEIRESTLGEVLKGNMFGGDTRDQVAQFLIGNAYIPGTDIQIFEAGDKEQILAWPFGKEFIKIQDAMNELMGIDIEAAQEELKADPLAE